MTFDRQTLVIPDNTKFDEHIILTTGDVIIGDRCLIEFGVKTEGRIFIGEHVIVDGNLESTKDIRIDNFSNIRGNVQSGGNVYLGEKVKLLGKLSLTGDLDVADSVDIKEGFEAKGWINIRSPIPIIIYIFIYLTQLLKMGHSEEIERLLEEIEENEGETIPISEIFLFFPNNSIVGIQKSRIEGNLNVGKKSRIVGNFDVKGEIYIRDNSILYGSLHATKDILCDKNIKLLGNIITDGEVRLDEKIQVEGDISARKIYLSKISSVSGLLYAKNGIIFVKPTLTKTEEKIKRFENNIDILNDVN